MYSRKTVGPGIDPRGTPALTQYSCEEWPSRKPPITEKRRNKAKNLT